VDANKKSIVACINNEKYIINRNSRKEIGFLKVEPTRIYEDYARLKITYSCEECSCDESCSNNLCYNQQAQEQKNEVPNENNAIINKENTVNDIVPFIRKWIATPGVDSAVVKNLDSMRSWLGTKLVSDEEDKIKAERTAGMACQHPFAVASMVYTGQLTLCCHDAFTELTDGSNIANTTFREWWHGAYITKMRADHAAGNYPPICVSCRERDTWLG